MELTYEELDKYLLKIFTGKEYTFVNDGYEDLCILFNSPSNENKLRADLIYKKSYSQAIDSGMLSLKDMEALIKDRGLYTDKDEAKVEKIRSKLYAQEVLLSKTTKVKANIDRIQKIINDLNNQINEITVKKSSRLALSAENKAEEDKTFFLCWACTYDGDSNTRYWDSYQDALKETNLMFKNKLSIEFLKFYVGISAEIIRYIARGNLWRIRYVSSQKVSDSLFGVPTSQYTNDQLNLVYWSNYYQNIYDMMPEDRPSDDVIDDDEALDSFMKSYYEEKARENVVRKGKNRAGGKLSAFDSEEVIVTQSNDLYEDINYDKPREAQRIKNKSFIKKRTRRSK
jgi:hypothetical protein